MKKLIYILFLFSIIACTDTVEKGRVIAEAYENELLDAEVIPLIPKGVSPEDSIIIVSNYINTWMQKQAILHKAILSMGELTEDRMQIDKRIEDYRNTLIIYEFEKRYVVQHLDTIVKYEQVESFYNEHKKEFMLKDDIVQVAYVKFFTEEKNLKLVRKLLKSYKPDDIIKIKNISEENAVNYLLDDDTWILFDDLVKEIPIQTYNKSLYLKNNKYIEVKDSEYTYMLRVNQYRIRNNYSPMSFEYERISKIIINIRKMEMIEQLQNNIFEEAQKEGKVLIKN